MHDSSPLPAGSTTISPPRVLCSSQRNSSVSSGRKIVDINNKVSGVIFLKSWKNLEDFNMEGATWYRERVNYRDGRDPRDILKSTDLRVGRIYWHNDVCSRIRWQFLNRLRNYSLFDRRWIFWWDRKIVRVTNYFNQSFVVRRTRYRNFCEIVVSCKKRKRKKMVDKSGDTRMIKIDWIP